eukprot:GHVU01052550.1.p1 GENE.GHVU01052550.1~~GHVU01052550.1.p1  ORF type:complete len:169 (-),score=9.06 GHVU01052550.1:1402-1908(-)
MTLLNANSPCPAGSKNRCAPFAPLQACMYVSKGSRVTSLHTHTHTQADRRRYRHTGTPADRHASKHICLWTCPRVCYRERVTESYHERLGSRREERQGRREEERGTQNDDACQPAPLPIVPPTAVTAAPRNDIGDRPELMHHHRSGGGDGCCGPRYIPVSCYNCRPTN